MGITESTVKEKRREQADFFKTEEKIGDIAARFPGAMEVFQDYQIDFCCGGGRPLAQVIEEQGLQKEEILAALNKTYQEMLALQEGDIDWGKAAYGDLIDYIVNKHHAFLREKLPEVSELTTTILRAHGQNHGEVLREVHRLFHTLKMDLEQHLIKEEEELFPAVQEYEQHPSQDKLEKASRIIMELEEEHQGAGDILKKLREVTADYDLPDDGCRTYELTFQLLKDLEKDLFAHIHLENNILFARLHRD